METCMVYLVDKKRASKIPIGTFVERRGTERGNNIVGLLKRSYPIQCDGGPNDPDQLQGYVCRNGDTRRKRFSAQIIAEFPSLGAADKTVLSVSEYGTLGSLIVPLHQS